MILASLVNVRPVDVVPEVHSGFSLLLRMMNKKKLHSLHRSTTTTRRLKLITLSSFEMMIESN